MLLFKSYTIKSIDKDSQNICVDFHFDQIDGESVDIFQELNYANDVGYTVKEMRKVAQHFTDVNGKDQVRYVDKEIEVTKLRKSFNMTDPAELDEQLQAYGRAFALGHAIQLQNVVHVSEEVEGMIGQKSK